MHPTALQWEARGRGEAAAAPASALPSCRNASSLAKLLSASSKPLHPLHPCTVRGAAKFLSSRHFLAVWECLIQVGKGPPSPLGASSGNTPALQPRELSSSRKTVACQWVCKHYGMTPALKMPRLRTQYFLLVCLNTLLFMLTAFRRM